MYKYFIPFSTCALPTVSGPGLQEMESKAYGIVCATEFGWSLPYISLFPIGNIAALSTQLHLFHIQG
jgi:hypothetical protein